MRRTAVATTFVTAALSLAVAAAGCDRKKPHDQAFPSQSDWQAPGGSAGAAGALPPPPSVGPGALAGQGGGAMGGGAMGGGDDNMPQDDVHAGLAGGHPGGAADVGQMGLPPPDPNRQIDPNKYLRGQIHPTDATKAKIPAGGVIFIAVKRADPKTGEPSGAPMAVERLTATGWPLAFELTEAQAMIGGTGFAGDVVVTARYDQDGDALSKQPGDVSGEVKATIPADKLDLALDTVLP